MAELNAEVAIASLGGYAQLALAPPNTGTATFGMKTGTRERALVERWAELRNRNRNATLPGSRCADDNKITTET
ncbi:hypothetical protein KFL_007400020 [Klebsormidium nitens]|uniref:Uncharacterized protein n=1 Tax=Klebsormidium nitens TaxID=105231 RepID=A0A1Y1IQZ6_KLENI|nr:hypothetical protein KFL_007400020 [Klebsormidium nitens]|eukprot:GAQ91186.1 hypothetical protein KFL_007400020 [Klebsormidium nitens]